MNCIVNVVSPLLKNLIVEAPEVVSLIKASYCRVCIVALKPIWDHLFEPVDQPDHLKINKVTMKTGLNTEVYYPGFKLGKFLGMPFTMSLSSKPKLDDINRKLFAFRNKSKVVLDNKSSLSPVSVSLEKFVINEENLKQIPKFNFSHELTPLVRDLFIEGPIPINKIMVNFEASNTSLEIKGEKPVIFVINCAVDEFLQCFKKFLKLTHEKIKYPTVFGIKDYTVGTAVTYDMFREAFETLKSDYLHRWIIEPVLGSDKAQISALSCATKSYLYENKTMYDTWNVKGNKYVDYKPKRRPTYDPVLIMRNAIDEIRELWRVKEKILFNQYSSVFQKMPVVITKQFKEQLRKDPEDYGILKGSSYLLVPQNQRNYEYCFNGKEFVPYGKQGKKGACTCRI